MNTILAECESCGGTGLYRGFAEREGEPVVCLTCQGTGAQEISYGPLERRKHKPFEGRKNRDGVRCVRLSRGSFIGTGVGGIGGSEMTYEEFRRRFPEPRVK